MAEATNKARVDQASRVILAPPKAIYQAFLNAEAVSSWRPPKGMSAKVFAFDPRVGGGYRMAYTYGDTDGGPRGKTSDSVDVFQGRFVELDPYERIVEEVEFESDDPAFAGTMTITTLLVPVADGTKVTFCYRDVPPGILPEDHQEGMASTLKNLAAFIE